MPTKKNTWLFIALAVIVIAGVVIYLVSKNSTSTTATRTETAGDNPRATPSNGRVIQMRRQ